MIIWKIFIIALHTSGVVLPLKEGEGDTPNAIVVQQLEAPKGAVRLQLKNVDRQEGIAQITVFDEAFNPVRMIPVELKGKEGLHTLQLQTLDSKTNYYLQVTAGNQTSDMTVVNKVGMNKN